MRVLVLMGGTSHEREVSLVSGRAVVAGLTERGHEVMAHDVTRWDDLPHLAALREADVVFPALHGGLGEDGHLQALLDTLDVPYALSGPLASALAMNKSASKRIMRGAGIPTPDWLQVTWDPSTGRPLALAGGVHDPDEGRNAHFSLDHIRSRVVDEIGFPVVLKPNNDGSSVGVEIVREPSGFGAAFSRVASRSQDLLIERYIPGRELTATIFLARRLPLIEIRPRQGFYDYANKYTAGATEYLVPAPVHSPLYEQISGDALRLFDLLECRGLARVDIRLDGDEHHCLELNTIPGLTPTSLVPKAAAAVGIGFADLIEDLCRAALERRPPAGMVPSERP